MPQAAVVDVRPSASNWARLLLDGWALGSRTWQGLPEHVDLAVLTASGGPRPDQYRPLQDLARFRTRGGVCPALIVSFEHLDDVLREPENAVAAADGSCFVRLPQPRLVILEALLQTPPLGVAALEFVVQSACTPWGQMERLLDRVEAGLRAGAAAAATERLQIASSFCTARWSGELCEVIRSAQQLAERGRHLEAADALDQVRNLLPEAVVEGVFDSLAHGATNDLVNRGLGPLRMLLVSRRRGTTSSDAASQILDSRQWQDFGFRLDEATRLLALALRRFSGAHVGSEAAAAAFVRASLVLQEAARGRLPPVQDEEVIAAIDEMVSAVSSRGREPILHPLAHP